METKTNDIKRDILDMLEQITSEDLLEMIAGFVYGGYKIEKERRQD